MDVSRDQSLVPYQSRGPRVIFFDIHLLKNVTLLNTAYFKTLGKGHSKHLAPASAVSVLDSLHTFCKWNHSVSFCDWLIPLSVMSSGFICGVAGVRIIFLFEADSPLCGWAVFCSPVTCQYRAASSSWLL